MDGKELCGCGKPVTHRTLDGDRACNQFDRCPTYAELKDKLDKAEALIRAYRMKRETSIKLEENIIRTEQMYG